MAFNLQAERERRNALAKETRNLLDQNPGASWTDDHQKQYDDKVEELERIANAIERNQKVMDLNAERNMRDPGVRGHEDRDVEKPLDHKQPDIRPGERRVRHESGTPRRCQ